MINGVLRRSLGQEAFYLTLAELCVCVCVLMPGEAGRHHGWAVALDPAGQFLPCLNGNR